MDTIIEKKVSLIIKDFDNKEIDNRLKEANDWYNEMVEEGKIERRGYDLASIEDLYLDTPTFNTVGSDKEKKLACAL